MKTPLSSVLILSWYSHVQADDAMPGDGVFGLRWRLCVATALVIVHEKTKSGSYAKTPPQSKNGLAG